MGRRKLGTLVVVEVGQQRRQLGLAEHRLELVGRVPRTLVEVVVEGK